MFFLWGSTKKHPVYYTLLFIYEKKLYLFRTAKETGLLWKLVDVLPTAKIPKTQSCQPKDGSLKRRNVLLQLKIS